MHFNIEKLINDNTCNDNCPDCVRYDCQSHPEALIRCKVCNGYFPTDDLIGGEICFDCEMEVVG